MGRALTLDDTARGQIIGWRQAAGMTKSEFGKQIGRNSSWVGRWEKRHFNADLTTLAKACAVFGHTIFEALEVSRDKRESEFIAYYRRMRAEARPLARKLLRELSDAHGVESAQL